MSSSTAQHDAPSSRFSSCPVITIPVFALKHIDSPILSSKEQRKQSSCRTCPDDHCPLRQHLFSFRFPQTSHHHHILHTPPLLSSHACNKHLTTATRQIPQLLFSATEPPLLCKMPVACCSSSAALSHMQEACGARMCVSPNWVSMKITATSRSFGSSSSNWWRQWSKQATTHHLHTPTIRRLLSWPKLQPIHSKCSKWTLYLWICTTKEEWWLQKSRLQLAVQFIVLSRHLVSILLFPACCLLEKGQEIRGWGFSVLGACRFAASVVPGASGSRLQGMQFVLPRNLVSSSCCFLRVVCWRNHKRVLRFRV